MKTKIKDVLIVGFALFAIFFGAGNLIFPPYLGVFAGSQFKKSMIGFLLTDPVLPILGVIVTAKLGGRAEDLGKRVGPTFAKVLGTVTILTIGPFFAIPRTAATTHEVFVSKVFPGVPHWITAILFFTLTAVFVMNESGVIEKIGKYLTPGLIVILGLIIIKCIITPIGKMAPPVEDTVFLKGFVEGYQTMDALGAAMMTGIVVSDLMRRGYIDNRERLKMTMGVGLVSFILLALIYGGLTYVGATASKIYTIQDTRVEILLGTVHHVLGNLGTILIGVAVSLACLTTSVGLTAICGDFFSTMTRDKIKYKPIVVMCVILSGAFSLFGVEGLIKAAGPILTTIYPIIIVLIFLGMIEEYIKYDLTYKGAVIATFIVSFIQSLNSTFNILEGPMGLIEKLPLRNVGFEWFFPALITAIIFTMIAKVISQSNNKSEQIN